MSTLNENFSDMLQCLNDSGVEYIVVGAFAMAHHGYVRSTGDIDIFINPSADNAQKIIKALNLFGAYLHGADEKDFSQKGFIFQIGVPPFRIDIITAIDGLSFTQAHSDISYQNIHGLKVPFLSIENLIKNKSQTGRLKDISDTEELNKYIKKN